MDILLRLNKLIVIFTPAIVPYLPIQIIVFFPLMVRHKFMKQIQLLIFYVYFVICPNIIYDFVICVNYFLTTVMYHYIIV